MGRARCEACASGVDSGSRVTSRWRRPYRSLTTDQESAILLQIRIPSKTTIRSSRRLSGVQRVGGRCEPDTSAGAEWTWESQAEIAALGS